MKYSKLYYLFQFLASVLLTYVFVCQQHLQQLLHRLLGSFQLLLFKLCTANLMAERVDGHWNTNRLAAINIRNTIEGNLRQEREKNIFVCTDLLYIQSSWSWSPTLVTAFVFMKLFEPLHHSHFGTGNWWQMTWSAILSATYVHTSCNVSLHFGLQTQSHLQEINKLKTTLSIYFFTLYM